MAGLAVMLLGSLFFVEVVGMTAAEQAKRDAARKEREAAALKKALEERRRHAAGLAAANAKLARLGVR